MTHFGILWGQVNHYILEITALQYFSINYLFLTLITSKLSCQIKACKIPITCIPNKGIWYAWLAVNYQHGNISFIQLSDKCQIFTRATRSTNLNSWRDWKRTTWLDHHNCHLRLHTALSLQIGYTGSLWEDSQQATQVLSVDHMLSLNASVTFAFSQTALAFVAAKLTSSFLWSSKHVLRISAKVLHK